MVGQHFIRGDVRLRSEVYLFRDRHGVGPKGQDIEPVRLERLLFILLLDILLVWAL